MQASERTKTTARILVLDDEPLFLEVITNLLHQLGFPRVTTCDNGYRALDLIETEGADIILCDLRMPELDGVQFVRHLKAKDFGGGLVLISGADERILQSTERLVHSYGVDVLGCIQKPFLPEELAGLLEKWFRPRSAVAGGTTASYSASEIRAAIAADELVTFYQPKVRVSDGVIIGAEVLARWRHPVDGLLPPMAFLDTAEDHELMEDLTRVVIRDALAQARAWQLAGLDISVGVNISMRSLSNLEFPDLVAAMSYEAGVPPRQLVLEVAESSLLADANSVMEILARLRLMGFGLAIEAFNAGSASIGLLRDLPFTELKIGRPILSGALSNRNTHALFNSGVALGKELGVDVVAEGVEHREDWDFLRNAGCAQAQGFFIAAPMPANELPAWRERWTERFARELAD